MRYRKKLGCVRVVAALLLFATVAAELLRSRGNAYAAGFAGAQFHRPATRTRIRSADAATERRAVTSAPPAYRPQNASLKGLDLDEQRFRILTPAWFSTGQCYRTTSEAA